MKKLYLFFLSLFYACTWAQATPTTEDKIYASIDRFIATPTEKSLAVFSAFEKQIAPKINKSNPAELLAYVILNCNKGYYEDQFGQTSKAVASYEKAWKIYQSNNLQNYDIIEYCLKPLGNLYTVLGDYSNAENSIKHYYDLASQGTKNPEMTNQKYAAILNLSIVYQCSGRYQHAIDLLEKALKTATLTKAQRGNLLHNLGTNYYLSTKGYVVNPKTFQKAENAFLQSILLLQNDKTQQEAVYHTYLSLSQFNRDRSDVKASLSYYEKAKVIFEKIPHKKPRQEAQFELENASLLLQQDQIVPAQKAIQLVFKKLLPNYSGAKNILPEQQNLYAETALLEALDLQATLYQFQNQPKKALEAYALAFHIEELFQSLLVYENSKIIIQTRNRKRAEKCIAIYQSLYNKEHKRSYLEEAFQLAEKTKSIVLKEHLIQDQNRSRKEKLILEQLQNWNTTITKEQQKGALATIDVISNAIKKQNELMLALKEIQQPEQKSPDYKVNFEDLYTKLDADNAILVAYFYGDENLYSFTFSDHNLYLNSIYVAHTTGPLLYSFISYFSNPEEITNNPSDFNRAGNAVYKRLKLPTPSSRKNLILIPDGLLNFLPFEALITSESTTTNFAKMKYLLHDFQVGYNNSVQFYVDDIAIAKPKKNVLGLFPIFEKTDYALDFSKNEMHSIQNKFDGLFFEKEKATFENFKSNAARYSILHLSTHATAGDTETAASIKFFDQEILYSELYNLNINPDLVVLSACETGIGKLYKSEGAMSIARGFQFAGAKNLLFSLWKVNDFTTSIFMDYFYHFSKKGNSYMEANHKAKLEFLADKTIPNAKKSPYYWSAFVYYGNPTAGQESFNYTFYFLGFITVIGLLLTFIGYKKWKNYKKS